MNTRYDELTRKLTVTRDLHSEARRTVTEALTTALADYLGCPPEKITLSFTARRVEDGDVTEDFTLAIKIEALNATDQPVISNMGYEYGPGGLRAISLEDDPYYWPKYKDELLRCLFRELKRNYV